MKMKTVEIDGKTYAEMQDGKPLYVHDDGKEVAFDAPAAVSKITALNREAQGHREAKEAAEARAKAFEGIDDAEAARKALETLKNIDEGKLLSAGKVEEIKAAAKRAAEEQVAAANKASTEKIQALEGDLSKRDQTIHGLLIGGAFKSSPLIVGDKAKFAIPADMVEARFGQHFKVEDGKVVAYDPAGNKIFSRERAGEVANFDEALDTLLDQYPYKDQIIKGAGQFGSGAGGSGGSGDAGTKQTGNLGGSRQDRVQALSARYPELAKQ